MKFIRMQYPDKSIHNIIVKTFGFNNKYQKHFIEYYDLTNSQNMYTILEKENQTFKKNPYLDNISYNEIISDYNKLNENFLPKEIGCVEKDYELNKPEVKTQKQMEFYVFTTNYSYFIASNICKAFKIGDRNSTKTINGIECFEVTKKEIEEIVEKTKNQDPCLKPIYNQILILKKKGQFIIYRDLNLNKYYIDMTFCKNHGIGNNKVLSINGIKCFEVTKEEIKKIEEVSKNTDLELSAYYIDINLYNSKQSNPNTPFTAVQKSFIVYKDIITLKLYMDVTTCKYFGIQSSIQHMINGISCLEVTQQQITEIEEKTKFSNPSYKAHYVDVFLEKKKENPKEMKINYVQKEFIVYKDVLTNKLYMEKNVCNYFGLKYSNGMLINGISCYEVTEQQITEIEERTKFSNPSYKATYTKIILKQQNSNSKKEEQKNDKVPIIIYKDKNNNEFYLPTIICKAYNIGNKNNFKYINNRECFEVTENEIDQISIKAQKENTNIDIIYVTVYLPKKVIKETQNIFVAKSGMYISLDLFKRFNLESKSYKIIDNEKYLKISIDDVKSLEKIGIAFVPTKIEQKINNFLVCRHNDSFYIDEYIANLFKLANYGSIRIEGKRYVGVTDQDIAKIEETTKNLDTALVRKYVNIKQKGTVSARNTTNENNEIAKPRERNSFESDKEYENYLKEFYDKNFTEQTDSNTENIKRR